MVLGMMGFWIGVFPPKKNVHKISLLVVFILLTIATAYLTWWTADRASKAQEDSRAEAAMAQQETTKEIAEIRRQLTSVKSDLGPFVETARSKHPTLSENDALRQLATDLREIKGLSGQVLLSYGSISAKMVEGNYVVEIDFVPSKDGPIGDVDLKIALPVGCGARIMSAEGWPSSDFAAMISSRQTLANDGGSADVVITVVGGIPGAKITLSEPVAIRIVGDRGLGTRVVNVPLGLRQRSYPLFPK